MTPSSAPPMLAVGPREARPESRFNLYAGLTATTVAVLSYVAFLSLHTLPPLDLATLMFGLAPLCGLIALPLVLSRSRAEDDAALRWFGTGLGLSVLAMLLQLISLPAIIGGRGPLGTDDQSSAGLYLLFHWALIAGTAAAVIRVPTRWCGYLGVGGSALVVATACNWLPLPTLIGPDQVFSTTLTVLQILTLVSLALALAGWVYRSGAIATSMRGWIGLTLLLLSYEILLNAMSAQRFDSDWWSSLTLRAVAFLVLVGGVTVTVTQQLRRFEGYSEREFARRESELDQSIAVGEQLLASANSLARVLLPQDVAAVLAGAVQEVSKVGDLKVFDLAPNQKGLRRLYGRAGSSEDGNAADAATVRLAVAAMRGEPVLLAGTDVSEREAARGRLPHDARELPTIIGLPLRAGGRAIGVLVGSADEVVAWSSWTRELILGLAAQAGPALSRARLYEREFEAAEALQRALLPERLPAIANVQLAGRYVAGQQGVDVGGDWYDCIELSNGRLALMVGDVMGKGVHAASLMGRLRDATRVLVNVDPSPSAVLDGLNDVLLSTDTERIATAAYLLLDPESYEVRMGLAGHLPPVLVPPVGAPKLVDESAISPLLGLPTQGRAEASFVSEPGSALILYTDGLVEDRRGVSDGLTRLLADAESLMRQEVSAQAFASGLLESAETASRTDDVAVLVAILRPAATA